MTKKGKKRRRQDDIESINLVCNVAQHDGGELETMEDCLAELEGSQAIESSHSRTESWSRNWLDANEAQECLPQDSKEKQNGKEKRERTHSFWDWTTARHPSLLATSTSSTQYGAKQRAWKDAFQMYLETGSYTDGLLPSVQVEISRHCSVESLSSSLLKKCSPNLRMPAFERWWIDSKWQEQRTDAKNKAHPRDAGGGGTMTSLVASQDDPVIPTNPSPTSPASQRLVTEIMECCSSISKTQAEAMVTDLCRDTVRAAHQVRQLALRCKSNPLCRGDRIEVPLDQSDDATVVTLSYRRPKWTKPYRVQLNRSHMDKLQRLFGMVHANDNNVVVSGDNKNNKNVRAKRVFHVLVMVLVLRYSSLAGGQLLHHLRGGGMQGAIHGEVFEVLQEAFSSSSHVIHLECFASPLNNYWSNYASAFASDVDWHFGSVGDFHDCDLREGCLEVNPPFAPGLMADLVGRLEEALQVANQHHRNLTFVVIVPTAVEKPEEKDGMAAAKRFAADSFWHMVRSPHCRMHIRLSAREHGYVEGAQHLRPTRYKQSAYDTSVIVLQSEKAKQSCLDDEAKFAKQIRAAFGSRHDEELSQRRSETPHAKKKKKKSKSS